MRELHSAGCDCKCGLAQRATRIVGGKFTEVNEYPWQAGLVSKGGSTVWCGGSLVNSKWVLTAAHCTDGSSPSSLQVSFPKYSDLSVKQTVPLDVEDRFEVLLRQLSYAIKNLLRACKNVARHLCLSLVFFIA